MDMAAVDSRRLTSSCSIPGTISASCPVAIAWPDTSNTFHWSSESFLPAQVNPESAISRMSTWSNADCSSVLVGSLKTTTVESGEFARWSNALSRALY